MGREGRGKIAVLRRESDSKLIPKPKEKMWVMTSPAGVASYGTTAKVQLELSPNSADRSALGSPDPNVAAGSCLQFPDTRKE